MPANRPYIPEVHKHEQRRLRWQDFTSSTTRSAMIMLVAAIVAVIVANTPVYPAFLEFWHADVTLGVGGIVRHMSLAHIVNDVLMAVFFLLVGLEIKYEVVAGDLSNPRQALLPVVAAFGGVLAPIVIYLAFNGGSTTASGWGVPTATDIAFALGVLSLLGDRVPNGLKVFLSTLAVADDIIAILVIAIFYGQSPSLAWLGAAALVMVALVALNRTHTYSLWPYLVLGVVLWYCVFMSGVHSTIAGVLLAFTIPCTTNVDAAKFPAWSEKKLRQANEALDPSNLVITQGAFLAPIGELSRVARQAVPPALRLSHRLDPWVYFLILPIFALTNADVSLTGLSVEALFASPVLLGVACGLVLGKPTGVMLASFLVVKFKLANLPEGVTWLQMFGASVLAGVGFTMAIFVANLAFTSDAVITVAKAGILLASIVAGTAGFVVLRCATRPKEEAPAGSEV